jgi:hypothetical protein
MKKLATILTIDFIVAGFVLFLVVKPTRQSARPGDGIIRGYVYAEFSTGNKNPEQVFLPGVLVTIKDVNGGTADIVKSKRDGSYTTKSLKPGNYKIFLSKNGFPVSWFDAIVGYSSNNPIPLNSNFNNDNYIGKTAKLTDGSAD